MSFSNFTNPYQNPADIPQHFPEELLPLRLFKCRMWFWFVVMGLYDNDPTTIKK